MKKKILIIGGFGFLGRNLYQYLIQSGYSEVNILSNVGLAPGDPFNDIFKHKCYRGSINSSQIVEEAIADHDVVFSFAGVSGAAGSISTPFEDIHTNLEGHLNLLEAARKKKTKTRLVFPSTRLVYGDAKYLPVDETHPLNPQSFYAIHKNTTERYYLLYSRLYAIETVIFRISNPYGYNFNPEAVNYSVLNQFIHKAIHGKSIEIYGDGSQQRDYFHIDDLSSLMETAINNKALNGNIYNIGSGNPYSIIQVAETIKSLIPSMEYNTIEWPSIEKKIETGDYISDITKITETTNWRPEIDLKTGIKLTIEAYKDSGRYEKS